MSVRSDMLVAERLLPFGGKEEIMPVSSPIAAVFGYFQNLNLLALLQDLRDGRTARHAWADGSLLCPVAHGLASGTQVSDLRELGQSAELGVGCAFAARQLGADWADVLHFVRSWDDEVLSRGALLRQLEEVWDERLADAEAVQEVLQGAVDAESERCNFDAGRGSLML
jgi:hypothetical protein